MLTINNMKIFKSKFKEFLKADSSNLTPTRGFAVLFTVLISSIILAIALGITSISYQAIFLFTQPILAPIARFIGTPKVFLIQVQDNLIVLIRHHRLPQQAKAHFL